jgi:polar amino acid transport system permease protein
MGLVIAVMRLSQVGPIRWFAQGYLEFIRNTPLLVQFFFWYFGSYQILPQSVNDWLNARDFEFSAAVIALTIYTSAFIAEDIRSGIRSIPKEQMEAPAAPASPTSAPCSTSSCPRPCGSRSRRSSASSSTSRRTRRWP